MSTMEEISNTSHHIKQLMHSLGLGQREFANLLGLGKDGERTVRGWENGEHRPSPLKWSRIVELKDAMNNYYNNAPLKQLPREDSIFTFIDLFAGIGGIRYPFQQLGGHCVFTSEWDKFAQKTYLENYGEMPNGDITQISAKKIPEHDILLAGFPCQAFSQAGLKKGFGDNRGLMFFEVFRIIAECKPKMLLLENVKQLRGHDGGKTLKTILSFLKGTQHTDPEIRGIVNNIKRCAALNQSFVQEFLPKLKEVFADEHPSKTQLQNIISQQDFSRLKEKTREKERQKLIEKGWTYLESPADYFDEIESSNILMAALECRLEGALKHGDSSIKEKADFLLQKIDSESELNNVYAERIVLSEETLSSLDLVVEYDVTVQVLAAKEFGIPQNRERIFIVATKRDEFGLNASKTIKDIFSWPEKSTQKTQVGGENGILQSQAELDADFEMHGKDRFTISDKLWEGHQKRKAEHKTKGNGFGYSLFDADSEYTNTISARYYKDGSEILIDQSNLGKNPRKLTPRECANLQGFPQEFNVDAVSQGQIYKQFGNSVCMSVVRAVATEMIKTLTGEPQQMESQRKAG